MFISAWFHSTGLLNFTLSVVWRQRNGETWRRPKNTYHMGWAQSVADLEQVPWVLWNPSFEELPSKYYKCTMYSMLTLELYMHFSFTSSNNAHVSTPVSRI